MYWMSSYLMFIISYRRIMLMKEIIASSREMRRHRAKQTDLFKGNALRPGASFTLIDSTQAKLTRFIKNFPLNLHVRVAGHYDFRQLPKILLK